MLAEVPRGCQGLPEAPREATRGSQRRPEAARLGGAAFSSLSFFKVVSYNEDQVWGSIEITTLQMKLPTARPENCQKKYFYIDNP